MSCRSGPSLKAYNHRDFSAERLHSINTANCIHQIVFIAFLLETMENLYFLFLMEAVVVPANFWGGSFQPQQVGCVGPESFWPNFNRVG